MAKFLPMFELYFSYHLVFASNIQVSLTSLIVIMQKHPNFPSIEFLMLSDHLVTSREPVTIIQVTISKYL